MLRLLASIINTEKVDFLSFVLGGSIGEVIMERIETDKFGYGHAECKPSNIQ